MPKLGFPFLSNTLFCPKSSLLVLRSSTYSALHNKEFEAIYSSMIQPFHKIQTQVFKALYTTDENVLIGAPTVAGRLSAQNLLSYVFVVREQPRAVCIKPYQEMVDQRVTEFRAKLENFKAGRFVRSFHFTFGLFLTYQQ